MNCRAHTSSDWLGLAGLHGTDVALCFSPSAWSEMEIASAKYCSKPEDVSESSAFPIASSPSSRFSGSKRALILIPGPKISAIVRRYCVSVILRKAGLIALPSPALGPEVLTDGAAASASATRKTPQAQRLISNGFPLNQRLSSSDYSSRER